MPLIENNGPRHPDATGVQCLWCGNDYGICGCSEHRQMIEDIEADLCLPASVYIGGHMSQAERVEAAESKTNQRATTGENVESKPDIVTIAEILGLAHNMQNNAATLVAWAKDLAAKYPDIPELQYRTVRKRRPEEQMPWERETTGMRSYSGEKTSGGAQ